MTDKARYKKLLSAWHKRRYLVTIELAQEILNEHPKLPTVLLVYGDTLATLTRYSEARKAIQKAISLSPDDKKHNGYVCMGDLYSRKESYRVSERWYRKAVSRHPSTTNLIYLGLSLQRQVKLAEAKKCYRRAAKLATDPPDEAYYNLGVAFRSEGKYRKALEYFEKAVAIDPKYRLAKNAIEDIEEYNGLKNQPTKRCKGRPKGRP